MESGMFRNGDYLEIDEVEYQTLGCKEGIDCWVLKVESEDGEIKYFEFNENADPSEEFHECDQEKYDVSEAFDFEEEIDELD